MKRWRCTECEAVCVTTDMLIAPHPFEHGLTIHGCRSCHSIDHFALLCDVAECRELVSCGWPSPSGYRQTCGTHWVRDEKETSCQQ